MFFYRKKMSERKALMIGINYTDYQYIKMYLDSCVNEVSFVGERLIKEYQLQKENITFLVDGENTMNGESCGWLNNFTETETYEKPTAENIKNAITNFVDQTSKGDSLLIYIAGHSVQTGTAETTIYGSELELVP